MHTDYRLAISGMGLCLEKADSPQKEDPPVDRMTDVCEKITFPHTLYAVGKYSHVFNEAWLCVVMKSLHHKRSKCLPQQWS